MEYIRAGNKQQKAPKEALSTSLRRNCVCVCVCLYKKSNSPNASPVFCGALTLFMMFDVGIDKMDKEVFLYPSAKLVCFFL